MDKIKRSMDYENIRLHPVNRAGRDSKGVFTKSLSIPLKFMRCCMCMPESSLKEQKVIY